MSQAPPKIIRSYRLVFRRRWRIFRIQGWRIPLPGGIELRLIGYWLAALAALLIAAALPLIGIAVSSLPDSLRYLALPLALAWLLSRWELDGRAPHRALIGLIAWRLRPRTLAALRPVPAAGAELAPLGALVLGPDLTARRYPRGRLRGPVRVLLRYPLRAERRGPLITLRPGATVPLHSAKNLELAAGQKVELRR